MKIFTQSGHSEYILAEKVSINGGKKEYLSRDLFTDTLLDKKTNKLNPQLISFKTNTEGYIDNIYTAVPRSLNTDGSAELELSGEKKSRVFLKNGLTFQNDFLVNTNTVVFAVPENLEDTDENSFSIKKITELSTNSTYITQAYNADELYMAPAVVIYYPVITSPNIKDNTVVVSKITTVKTEDGALTKKVYFYEKGRLNEKYVSPDIPDNIITGLKPGMVIQYVENFAGEINGINIVFDYDNPTTTDVTDSYSALHTIYGTVDKLNGNAFIFRTKTTGEDELIKPYQFMGSNTYFYIFNVKSGTLSPASKSDIPVCDDNSMVFIRFYYAQSRETVIYTNIN